MSARHHHYISQCYLKGFTKGGSKKSKLTVIDFKEKKRFKTTPRNVGGVRDFNRIEIEGVDPNAIEYSLSKFEGEVASAFYKIEKELKFEGNVKDVILNFIALLAIRSPERREHIRKFHAEIAERSMDLVLATKERWEHQTKKVKESGVSLDEDISYEEMKRFHESGEYTINIPREYQIGLEFKSIETILPYLYDRSWVLIRTTPESGSFITTDHPVNLNWKEPEKVPPLYRNNPGHGMKNTTVYFPISKNIALSGEFDGAKGIIDGTRELIAALNSRMLRFAFKQLYAPNIGFEVLGKKGCIFNGIQILRKICA